MFDDNYEVHPEIAKAIPSVEEPQVELEQVKQEAPVQQQVQSQESDKEINLRILRERAAKAERERDEALRIAQQYQQPKQQHIQQDDEEPFAIGSDDIVEGKHLSKVQKELKKLKEELNQYKQQSSTHTAEARLKAQYPDFDKVVTRDNIETLKYAYPELAATLQSSSDLYNTGVSAYTLIKKFNIDNTGTPLQEIQKIQNNTTKPKSINTVAPQQGDTPLSRANAFANGLTEDLKKQLVAEMNMYRKNY